MGNPLTALISPLTKFASGFGERKLKKKQFQHEENIQEAQRLQGLDVNDAAYAIAQIKAGESSWKDEFITLVLFIPAILCFIDIPSLHGPQIVSAGFTALDKAPLWYQSLLTTAAMVGLGVNEYRKHTKKSLKRFVAEKTGKPE